MFGINGDSEMMGEEREVITDLFVHAFVCTMAGKATLTTT